MSVLDILINDNKGPKKGMEYIYLLNMVWRPNSLKSIPIKRGTIVHNVKKLPNDSFEFNIDDSGTIYRTNYGWSLVENTEDNRSRLEDYETANNKLKELEVEVKRLRSRVSDLDGKSKI